MVRKLIKLNAIFYLDLNFVRQLHTITFVSWASNSQFVFGNSKFLHYANQTKKAYKNIKWLILMAI